jgi:hypothetical protein
LDSFLVPVPCLYVAERCERAPDAMKFRGQPILLLL